MLCAVLCAVCCVVVARDRALWSCVQHARRESKVGDVIGEGNFGQVKKALVKQSCPIPVRQRRHYFSRTSHAFLGYVPPLLRDTTLSTYIIPMRGADCCVQSDVVTS